jgi:hypothetical protein
LLDERERAFFAILNDMIACIWNYRKHFSNRIYK